MGTTVLSCGCSKSSSMFGERYIMNINVCYEHASLTQKQLQAAFEAILVAIQKTNEDIS